jgi:protein-S-isoprenylcysteine O-methyltransferase Ste14
MRGFTRRGGWWVAGQAVLLTAVAAAFLTGGADWGFPSRAAGLAVAGAGAVQAGLGLAALGEGLTPFPAPRPGGALVERGIYRLVRHPIYGGLCLGSAGLGVFDGNPPVIVLAGGLTAYMWAKSGHEEQRLLGHYPDYAGYRDRVTRRLVPWVI